VIEHTRAVVAGVRAYARAVAAIHDVEIDDQRLLVVALLHDASKLIEYEPDSDGKKQTSEVGRMFPHATLGGFACLSNGLPIDVAHEVVTHTIGCSTRPQSLEGVLLYYVDMACSDLLRFTAEAPLHLAGRK
jgi:hypothetical protein